MAVAVHPSPAPRGVILTVDDCATTRAWICAALEALGYEVQAVDNGAAALAAAWQQRFDAIVLDVEMPGVDGMAVGRALRQDPRTAHAKIAMHTGLDEAEVRAGFSQYDAFVPKAGNPALLRDLVDRLAQACSTEAA